MRDLLPPLFEIATGLTFLLVLVVGLGARKAISGLHGRLAAFGIVAAAAGMFFMSRGTGATSLGAGADMFIAAGACFFVSAVLVAVSLVLSARARVV